MTALQAAWARGVDAKGRARKFADVSRAVRFKYSFKKHPLALLELQVAFPPTSLLRAPGKVRRSDSDGLVHSPLLDGIYVPAACHYRVGYY
jgi:hypothetical protein